MSSAKPSIPQLNMKEVQDKKEQDELASTLSVPKTKVAVKRPASAASHPIKKNTPTRPNKDTKVTPMTPSQVRKSISAADEGAAFAASSAAQAADANVHDTKTSARRRELSARSVMSTEELYNYERIVYLENDMRSLQKMYDTVNAEKSSLDKVVQVKQQSLVKAVSELEHANEQIVKLQSEVKQRDIRIADIEKEKSILSSVEIVRQMTEGKTDKTKLRREQLKATPEEALDRIVIMDNELKLKDTKIATLEKEINTLNILAGKREKAIEDITKQLDDYKYKYDKAFELECKNNELNNYVDKLTKEVRTLTTLHKSKTQTIEKLSSEIQSLKDVREKNIELEKLLVVKDKNIKELADELQFAQKSNEKKEQEIHKIIHEKDDVPVRSLEGDKIFLQGRIKKLQDEIDRQKTTIGWYNDEINKLYRKLHNVEQACKEIKIGRLAPAAAAPQPAPADESVFVTSEAEAASSPAAGQESVSIELFDLLQRDVEELRKQLQTKENVVADKDVQIESLEKKIDVMEQKQASENKKTRAHQLTQYDQIEYLKKKLQELDNEFKNREKDLKKQLIDAKNAKRPGTTPSTPTGSRPQSAALVRPSTSLA